MNRILRTASTFVAFSGALLLAACGSGGRGSAQLGTLVGSRAESPAAGFHAVNITVNDTRGPHSPTASYTNAGGCTRTH